MWQYNQIYSEIYHHGILGMKWGVRNGPPYPLNVDAHSKNEERENWRRSLNGKNERLYNRNKDEESFFNREEPKNLSDKTKKALKTAAIIGLATLGAVAVYKLSKTGLVSQGEEYVASYLSNNTGIFHEITGVANSYKDSQWLQKAMTESGALDYYHGGYGIIPKIASKAQLSASGKKGIDAIYTYTGSSYSDINKYLRGITKHISSNLKKTITNLDEVLEKSSSPSSVLVHRGMGYDHIADILGVTKNDLLNPEKLVGHVFTEKGFMSTSIAPHGSFSGVKCHFIVPKGAKGLFVAPVSKYSTELEYLLPRNTSFAIKDVILNKYGGIQDLILEIVM